MLDSQLSAGVSIRTESPDSDAILPGNSEDGNANFRKEDVFSRIIKGSHDLDIRYRNYGAFIRGKYWYDHALEDQDVRYGHSPTATIGSAASPLEVVHAGRSRLDDSDFHHQARFKGAEILDAYVYGGFDIAGRPVDVRLGRQVVSWGESTFIIGGINSINPIDVNAFQRPGAEVKEGLLPVNMVYANAGITDSLSAEMFYLLEFRETVAPGCGTFFSTNDFIPEGCDIITLDSLRASAQRDENGNRRARDDGQYGFAARYIAEALDDTEFGFYYMNLHSRLPVASGRTNNVDEVAIGNAAATQWIIDNAANPLAPTPAELQAAAQVGNTAGLFAVIEDSAYFVEYPEDIPLYGLSFATTAGAWAVSGEVSHREGVPLQINSDQLITVALTGSTQSLASIGMASAELDAAAQAAGEGGVVQGYRRFDLSQAQVTLIRFFDQLAGASRVSFISEIGYTHVHDLKEGRGEIRFGRSGSYPGERPDEGFVTSSSWGYRARVSAQYEDVHSGINLTPVIAWSHDVHGYAPEPDGVFGQGEKSLGLTVHAEYQNTYGASLSYTQFFGGDYSAVADRDYVSLSATLYY